MAPRETTCMPGWLRPPHMPFWGTSRPSHRPVDLHDLPEHLGDVRQGVRRQAEAARVQQLVDELLAQLVHHLADELLPYFKVLLVLWEEEEGGGEAHPRDTDKLLLALGVTPRTSSPAAVE